MTRLCLILALLLSARAFAEPDVQHARKLKLAGTLTVVTGALLLVGTAIRAAVPPPSDTNYCGDPCLDHARVRDMAILSGIATGVFAIGIPLLAYAHDERKRARVTEALSGRFTF